MKEKTNSEKEEEREDTIIGLENTVDMLKSEKSEREGSKEETSKLERITGASSENFSEQKTIKEQKPIREQISDRRTGKWFKTKEEMKNAVDILPCDSYVIITVTNYKKILEDTEQLTRKKCEEKIQALENHVLSRLGSTDKLIVKFQDIVDKHFHNMKDKGHYDCAMRDWDALKKVNEMEEKVIIRTTDKGTEIIPFDKVLSPEDKEELNQMKKELGISGMENIRSSDRESNDYTVKIGREDIILEKENEEIEKRLKDKIKNTDCLVKYDLCGLFTLIDFALDERADAEGKMIEKIEKKIELEKEFLETLEPEQPHMKDKIIFLIEQLEDLRDALKQKSEKEICQLCGFGYEKGQCKCDFTEGKEWELEDD